MLFVVDTSICTQNVLAAVDFDQKFTYVLAGWEGTSHDALVLHEVRVAFVCHKVIQEPMSCP
jgi:hypothetical protein